MHWKYVIPNCSAVTVSNLLLAENSKQSIADNKQNHRKKAIFVRQNQTTSTFTFSSLLNHASRDKGLNDPVW